MIEEMNRAVLSEKRKAPRKDPRVRRNGFDTPVSGRVIITFVYSILEAATYSVIIAPFIIEICPLGIGISIIVIWSLLYIITIYSTIMCMCKDPTDPYVYKSRSDNSFRFDYECQYCDAYVHEKAKH